jgi:hypothetical protein
MLRREPPRQFWPLGAIMFRCTVSLCVIQLIGTSAIAQSQAPWLQAQNSMSWKDILNKAGPPLPEPPETLLIFLHQAMKYLVAILSNLLMWFDLRPAIQNLSSLRGLPFNMLPPALIANLPKIRMKG